MSLLWRRQLSMQIRIDPCISIKLTHDCVRTAAFCQSIKEPDVISSPSGQPPPGPRQFPSQRFWTKIHPGCGAEPVSTNYSACLGVWLSIVLFCLRSLFIGHRGAWNIRPQGGKLFQNSYASFTCKQAALLSFSVTAYPSSGLLEPFTAISCTQRTLISPYKQRIEWNLNESQVL